MKLYTEEQVRIAIDIALNGINQYYTPIIDRIKPIELPSDEEIREEGLLNFPNSEYVDRSNDRLAYYVGAKWMRDKLLTK